MLSLELRKLVTRETRNVGPRSSFRRDGSSLCTGG
jgi:hypothetical protein